MGLFSLDFQTCTHWSNEIIDSARTKKTIGNICRCHKQREGTFIIGIICFLDWFQKCKRRFIWNLSNCQDSVTDISREAACQNLTPENARQKCDLSSRATKCAEFAKKIRRSLLLAFRDIWRVGKKATEELSILVSTSISESLSRSSPSCFKIVLFQVFLSLSSKSNYLLSIEHQTHWHICEQLQKQLELTSLW